MTQRESDELYQILRCYQSDKFLVIGALSIPPKWCISVRVVKFHHIGIIFQQSNEFSPNW